MNVGEKWKRRRTANLYFGLATGALGVCAGLIYSLGFGAHRPEYFDAAAVVLPIVGLVLYLGLVSMDLTARFAGVALWGCVFGAFILYVKAAYMHLAEVFYSGINMDTLKLMDPGFMICTLLYLICAILANVVMWKKMDKDKIGGEDHE